MINKSTNLNQINQGFISRRKNDRTSLLDDFLTRIRYHQPISKTKVSKLFNIIRTGDEKSRAKAITEIVDSNQRFVYAMAKRFTNDESLIMDLISEGNIGMLEAINSYNPVETEASFLTYASYYIMKYMYCFVLHDRLVSRPYMEKTIQIVPKIKEAFIKEHGRMPTDDEVADILIEKHNIKLSDTHDVSDAQIYDIDSFVNPDRCDRDATMLAHEMETNPNTYSVNEFEKTEKKEYNQFLVENLINTLSKKEQEVIRKLYGIGTHIRFSMDEVSREMNICPERVRQLHASALKKMKASTAHFHINA